MILRQRCHFFYPIYFDINYYRDAARHLMNNDCMREKKEKNLRPMITRRGTFDPEYNALLKIHCEPLLF